MIAKKIHLPRSSRFSSLFLMKALVALLLGCSPALLASTACCPDGGLFPSAAGGDKVFLSPAQIKNLGLETAEVVEAPLEITLFALGRIEAVPNKEAAVSSRIPGRVLTLSVNPGDEVRAGTELLKIESRQPGDPPPTISIKAPIDGTVCEMTVRPGDPVEPERRLLDIANLREVMAVAQVFEHQAGLLKPGRKARIRVPAYPDQIFIGEMIQLGTSVDRQTGTIDAIFRIDNQNLLLRPGMRAEFSIITEEKPAVLTLPREAILSDGAGSFVYVADYDTEGLFARVPVRTGATNDQVAEILSGLFPGDQVVTRGNFALQYAGAGSASLKEVMDAAHGHAHGPNGEELGSDSHAGHAHEHDHKDELEHTEPAAFPFLPVGIAAGLGIILGLVIGGRRRHA